MAEIERQLGGAARQVAPISWLADLFTSRQLEEQPASQYLAQSPYYKKHFWDLPENSEMDVDSSHFDGETFEEFDARCPADPWRNDNEGLQQRFMDIFNDVLTYFGLSQSRIALATESTADERDDVWYSYDEPGAEDPPHFSTRPDIVLLGEDVRQLNRALDSYTRTVEA